MPYNDQKKAKKRHHKYYLEHKIEWKEKCRKWHSENKDRANELARNWYKENKESCIQRAIEFRNKKINWFISFMGAVRLHCDRCKYDKSFAAIQLHHTNPKQKENVGDSFSKWVRKLSFENFQKKILETDFIILCANCHIELHAGLWEW